MDTSIFNFIVPFTSIVGLFFAILSMSQISKGRKISSSMKNDFSRSLSEINQDARELTQEVKTMEKLLNALVRQSLETSRDHIEILAKQSQVLAEKQKDSITKLNLLKNRLNASDEKENIDAVIKTMTELSSQTENFAKIATQGLEVKQVAND